MQKFPVPMKAKILLPDLFDNLNVSSTMIRGFGDLKEHSKYEPTRKRNSSKER